MASDPLLVRDIYIAAFDYEEESKESTQVWQSQILGLTSTKSQDFGGARYQLGEAFPTFLSTAPMPAVEALIAVRLAYARRRSSGPGIDRDVAIDWGAGETKILGDGSHFWDRNPLDHDEEVKMLGAFEGRLDELAAAEDPELGELLEALRSREVPAAIWRRVLGCARRSPETFTEGLVPLLRNPEALAERDLTDVIAAFLPASLPLLDPVVREEIEAAIAGLPSTYGTRRPDLGAYAAEAGEHTRDELLGGLAPDDLLTAAAGDRARELQATSAERGTAPEGLPVGEWGATPAAAEPQGGEEAVAIGELTERLRSFNDDHLNEAPLRAPLEATAAPLRELWGLLASDHDGLPADLRSRAFEEAARSAATAVRARTDDVPPSLLDLAGEVLLASAAHPEPRPDAKRDEGFDRSEGWSEAPRIQAAVGLLQLASLEGRAGEPVLAAIEALAADPVASVRAQVARRAFLLRTAAPELMWRIAEAIRDGDPSTAVRKALVRALPRMAPGEGRRIGEFAEALYAGAPAEERGRALRNACVEILADLYLYRDDVPAGAFLRERVLAEPGLRPDGVRQAALQLRDTLVHGGEDPDHAALRARAIALAEFAVEAGAGELRRQLERVQQKGTAGDETDEDFRR
ncbi:MAG TPA: hypothetical protein VKG03_04485, partial [Solirubrobacterales bacterium]|nr:hypothetical protein [Solirubrobacterales bacterium]